MNSFILQNDNKKVSEVINSDCREGQQEGKYWKVLENNNHFEITCFLLISRRYFKRLLENTIEILLPSRKYHLEMTYDKEKKNCGQKERETLEEIETS